MATKYTQYPYLHRGKNAAYRTSVSSHEPVHSKARINWFIFGSWSVVLIMCLAFWAGVIALFTGI